MTRCVDGSLYFEVPIAVGAGPERQQLEKRLRYVLSHGVLQCKLSALPFCAKS